MKILLLTFVLLSSVTVCGQSKPDSIKYEEIWYKCFDGNGEPLEEDGNSKTTKECESLLKSFIKDNQKNNYGLIAKFLAAQLAFSQNKFDSAIPLYKSVLQPDFLDSISNYFKRHSARQLARIYIIKRNYDEAIFYTDKSKRNFENQLFCGNAIEEDKIAMDDLYSDCYIGKLDYSTALQFLTPHTFSNPFANNYMLTKKLYETYRHLYGKKKLRKEFLQAEKTIDIKQVTQDEYISVEVSVEIFGTKTEIPLESTEWALTSKKNDSELKLKYTDIYKKSLIYELSTKRLF